MPCGFTTISMLSVQIDNKYSNAVPFNITANN